MNWRKTQQRVLKLRCLASDVLCHILQGGATADSADCCMICLVWPVQTADSVHNSHQSSPHQQTRPVIGCQPLMLCSDWLLGSLPAALVWVCTPLSQGLFYVSLNRKLVPVRALIIPLPQPIGGSSILRWTN